MQIAKKRIELKKWEIAVFSAIFCNLLVTVWSVYQGSTTPPLIMFGMLTLTTTALILLAEYLVDKIDVMWKNYQASKK